MGIVHGGVYCSMIESMASVAAYTWLAARGGGTVVGRQQQHRLPALLGSGTVFGTAEPIHRGRRQQLWLVTITDATTAWSPAARCGCRIWSREADGASANMLSGNPDGR